MLLNPSEPGSLAPIEVVMLPEAFAFAAQQRQHLNGKRGARFQIVLPFRFLKNLII